MSSTGSSRGNPSMGDVVRSVVVIGAIILAIWGVGRLLSTKPRTAVAPVDYATIVKEARPAAGFPLLAPPHLPTGWRATSARFDPGTAWHLGVLTDDDQYIGLEQGTISTSRAVARFADGSRPAGTAQVAGARWSVRTGPHGRLTLVRQDGGISILVNGTASRSVIDAYVSSLSAS